MEAMLSAVLSKLEWGSQVKWKAQHLLLPMVQVLKVA